VSIETRLTRLSPALSARERAILVLGSLKDDTPEDPAWRRTMPQEQVREFNRLIHLMNVANQKLATYIHLVAKLEDELQLRQAWLVSLILWQEHVDEIRRAVRLTVEEPITESDYAAKVDALRAEWVPVEELAGLLAGGFDGWQDDDFREDEEGNREITDEAWDRVLDEKERDLRKLVEDGSLPGRGRGKSLKIQMGAFDDRMGRETGACPEDYLSYRVVPDSAAEEAERERWRLRRLNAVLDWKPFYASEEELAKPSRLGMWREMLDPTTARCLASCWGQLRAAEIVLDEVAAEFNSIDPLRAETRQELVETKQKLLETKEQLAYLEIEVELPEPDDELLETLREVVRRAVG